MSTEVALEPTSTTTVVNNGDDSASSIMSRFNAMNSEPEPAASEPQAPASEPQPQASEPQTQTSEPQADSQVDDSGVDTPLSELGGKTEEPARSEDDPPGVQTPAAKYKWGELRKKADEYDKIQKEILPLKEKELAEFKAKVEELAKVDPELYDRQIKEKEAAISEYEKKLAVYDIRESKQYREEVLAPLENIGETVGRIAAQYEMDAVQIIDALNTLDPVAQERKIMQITEAMHPRHQAKLFDYAEQVLNLNSKAEMLENNALEARKELDFLREQETRKQSEEQEKRVQIAAEAVRKQFQSKIPELKDEALAKKVFSAELSPQDPTRLAYNAYAGEFLPAALKELATTRAKVAELEKTLAARSAAQPRAGGSGPASQAPSIDPSEIQGETLWQRMRAYQQMQA